MGVENYNRAMAEASRLGIELPTTLWGSLKMVDLGCLPSWYVERMMCGPMTDEHLERIRNGR